MTSDRDADRSGQPRTANPRRTQVERDPHEEIKRTHGEPKHPNGRPHGDPHNQDWDDVADEVREAVEDAGHDTGDSGR